LRSLTKDYDERIFRLSKDLDTKVREHNKIREQINIFKDKLGKGEPQKGEGEPKELTPDDIANKLKEKEESIQDVEKKTYDEEQKLDELKNEFKINEEKKKMLEGPKLEGTQQEEDLSKTQAIKVSKVDQTRLETMKGEFEQVRKEVNEIMSKFKNMHLARVLKVQSEMEGIEFNWNNYQQTLKILETFVDALLTAKTKKTKPDENLIIKIVKEDKPFDNSGMDAIKILKEGLKNRPEREQKD